MVHVKKLISGKQKRLISVSFSPLLPKAYDCPLQRSLAFTAVWNSHWRLLQSKIPATIQRIQRPLSNEIGLY